MKISLQRPVAIALARRLGSDSLLRNSVYIMATTLVNSLCGYLYWIVATHAFSAHDVGLAAMLISTMTLASSLSTIGICTALIQVLPGRTSGPAWSLTFNAAIAACVASSLLAGAVALVVLPLFSPQVAGALHSSPLYAVCFLAGVPLWSLMTLCDYTFVAERAAGNMLARNAIFALLKNALLIAALPLAAFGALAIFGSAVLAAVCGAAAGFVLALRLRGAYTLALRGIARQIRAMLSAVVGNHLITLGGSAPAYLLPVIVTARLSAADNAYFYTTWMLGSLFFIVSPAVASSLFAEGSHAAGNLPRKVRTSLLIIGALLGPAMLAFLVGGRYVLALFGPAYARHGLGLLTVLIVSAVPDAITNVYVAVLRVQRRLGQAARLNLGMAALALLLAWLLSPPLGITGAGWAWLCAQCVGSIVVGTQLVAARARRQAAGAVPALSPASARKES